MRRLIMAATLLLSALSVQATQFEEGVHYEKVNGLTASDAEVREYFSFYCPHCFEFESHLKVLKAQLPEGAEFVRSHVDFMRMASPKMQKMLTKALIVAKNLDQEELLVAQIFNYIHKYRAVFTSERDVRNVFVNAGVENETFEKLFNSEEVAKEVEQMQHFQNTLARNGGLSRVPTIIVNGKYLVNAHKLEHSSINEKLSELVNHLLTLEK